MTSHRFGLSEGGLGVLLKVREADGEDDEDGVAVGVAVEKLRTADREALFRFLSGWYDRDGVGSSCVGSTMKVVTVEGPEMSGQLAAISADAVATAAAVAMAT